MKHISIIVMCVVCTGCTDTQVGRIGALGKPAEIVCYSGGREIYRGVSTGKVLNARESDGYEFIEAGTDKLVRTNADCIIRN